MVCLCVQELMTVFQLLHWNGSLKAMRERQCSRQVPSLSLHMGSNIQVQLQFSSLFVEFHKHLNSGADSYHMARLLLTDSTFSVSSQAGAVKWNYWIVKPDLYTGWPILQPDIGLSDSLLHIMTISMLWWIHFRDRGKKVVYIGRYVDIWTLLLLDVCIISVGLCSAVWKATLNRGRLFLIPSCYLYSWCPRISSSSRSVASLFNTFKKHCMEIIVINFM